MEIITTKSQLIERLRDIKTVEMIARESYVEDMLIFKNPELVNTISKIKVDEDRHIDMLSEMLDILEK